MLVIDDGDVAWEFITYYFVERVEMDRIPKADWSGRIQHPLTNERPRCRRLGR